VSYEKKNIINDLDEMLLGNVIQKIGGVIWSTLHAERWALSEVICSTARRMDPFHLNRSNNSLGELRPKKEKMKFYCIAAI
jgi:hypothetical protein